ncbi:MAG: ImmA/IrrE family metallo-endopeptidase [Desulfurivibrionaceae bacterium]
MLAIDNPSQIAHNIINELRIKHPSEIAIELIAEDRGATVVEALMTSAEGRLVRKGNIGKITVPSSERNIGRKRFSIAHELGHFELHSERTNLVVCGKRDMHDWKNYKTGETEANEFAASLLMPEALFYPRIILKKPNMNLIGKLANEFSTSLTATAFRYIQLTNEPCALVYCHNGKIEWFFKTGKDFPYFLRGRGESVDPESFAYDAFYGEGDNNAGNMVDPSAWLKSEFNSYSEIELYESTTYLKYYNSTITLLWEK